MLMRNLTLLLLAALNFLGACGGHHAQDAETVTTPDRNSADPTRTNAGATSETRNVKELSAYLGTNLIGITILHHAIDTGGQTNLLLESMSINGRTTMRSVNFGREKARQYKLDRDKAIMELDRDGDGHFETILFIAGGGAEVVGFRRTKAGEVVALGDQELQKQKEAISLFAGPPAQTDPTGKNICMWNLSQIEGAKELWAREKQKREIDIPSPTDLEPYLDDGFASLKCPKGGVYSFNRVDDSPSCSIHGSLR